MIERLQDVVNETIGRTDIVLTHKMKLEKEVGLNSLTIVGLICAIEDEFDLEIPNSAIKNFKTVGDVVKFLEKNAD